MKAARLKYKKNVEIKKKLPHSFLFFENPMHMDIFSLFSVLCYSYVEKMF